MKLQARSIGPPPRVGDYLMSEVRPRFAYRIERLRLAYPRVGWDKKEKAEERLLKIDAVRIDKSAVPRHATIHPWKWDKREVRAALLKRST